jgi:hypothetical protein
MSAVCVLIFAGRSQEHLAATALNAVVFGRCFPLPACHNATFISVCDRRIAECFVFQFAIQLFFNQISNRSAVYSISQWRIQKFFWGVRGWFNKFS